MLHRSALFVAIACGAVAVPPVLAASTPDMARWQAQAANVSIARDTWGIPHVTGKSAAATAVCRIRCAAGRRRATAGASR
jgi:acyl-homoserine-lactone acylase